MEKKLKNNKDPELTAQFDLLKRVLPVLEAGQPARDTILKDDYEISLMKQLQLLTSKPIVYVCNVPEHETSTGNALSQKVAEYAAKQGSSIVIISAAIEAEVAQLSSQEEKEEFLKALGLMTTGLTRVIQAGYALLDLITYFTIGPKEARAWTIKRNTKAPQAAGEIHGDFERGFICAETIAYSDYITYNGEQGAKAAGKARQEGRDYIVQDGDIFHFRFNV
jgi:GTP-binding protein YchF